MCLFTLVFLLVSFINNTLMNLFGHKTSKVYFILKIIHNPFHLVAVSIALIHCWVIQIIRIFVIWPWKLYYCYITMPLETNYFIKWWFLIGMSFVFMFAHTSISFYLSISIRIYLSVYIPIYTCIFSLIGRSLHKELLADGLCLKYQRKIFNI